MDSQNEDSNTSLEIFLKQKISKRDSRNEGLRKTQATSDHDQNLNFSNSRAINHVDDEDSPAPSQDVKMTLQDFQKSDDNKAHLNKCQTDEKVIYEHDLESISQTEKQSQTQ